MSPDILRTAFVGCSSGGSGGRRSPEHCTLLPFPEYPANEEPPGTRWFAGPDSLLREDHGMTLMARARTEEALGRVRDLISGDWLNDY